MHTHTHTHERIYMWVSIEGRYRLETLHEMNMNRKLGFRLVIHAYNYLRSKIEIEDKPISNTECPSLKQEAVSTLEGDELPSEPQASPKSENDENREISTATMTAQANLNAANMALAIFKNAAPKRISSPINKDKDQTNSDSTATIQITDEEIKQEKKDETDSENQNGTHNNLGFSMNLGPVNQGNRGRDFFFFCFFYEWQRGFRALKYAV